MTKHTITAEAYERLVAELVAFELDQASIYRESLSPSAAREKVVAGLSNRVTVEG